MELGGVVVPHRRNGELFLLCIDGNARVGNIASAFLGGEEPDENGEFFHSFLARTGTVVPATFRRGRWKPAGFVQGECAAWTM